MTKMESVTIVNPLLLATNSLCFKLFRKELISESPFPDLYYKMDKIKIRKFNI